MVTYIYFVKCPNCEDEHFDFFDEAKDFALGCLSQKPIITQTEVCRNDFGECTDSADLGTVWSWEEAMKDTECGYTDAEPAVSVFTKDDLKLMADGKDPEFESLDNSLEPDEPSSKSSESPDSPASPNSEPEPRKPIPEGMTIEQLVEEMEENEDTVECTWCEELFDKSECRKEVNLGWLCSRCEAAIKSRGETLTFRENNYWDFLDEEVDDLKEASLSDIAAAANSEFGSAYSEDDFLAGAEDIGFFDDLETPDEVSKELYAKRGMNAFGSRKSKLGEATELHDLGNEYDGGYPTEKPELPEFDEVSDSHLRLCPECGKETFDIETGICVDCGFN